MQPRLSSSRKWSALPAEFLKQVQGVFEESFKKEIDGGKITVQGKIFPEEVLIRVTYKTAKSLKESGFDISVAYKVPKDNVLKILHMAVDAGASLMEQLFTNEDDHDFPRVWEEVTFENRPVFVQYTTENGELESEANKLLGFDEDEDLAGGDWDDDDIDPSEIKAKLGLEDEDFEEEEDDEEEGEEAPVVRRPAKAKPTKH
jgi:hypothetical protein